MDMLTEGHDKILVRALPDLITGPRVYGKSECPYSKGG